MAVEDAVKSRIGEEFFKQIVLGYRAAMPLNVGRYRAALLANDSMEAEKMIRHAVDSPARFKARIDSQISQYGRAYLTECMAAWNVSTGEEAETLLTEIEAELAGLIDYAAAMVTDYKSGTLTYAGIADKIETDIPYDPAKWIYPIPERKTVWDN